MDYFCIPLQRTSLSIYLFEINNKYVEKREIFYVLGGCKFAVFGEMRLAGIFYLML
jgi:hypothetical protein